MSWKLTAKTATIHKRTIGSHPIPHTYGRLKFRTEDYAIIDTLTNQTVLPWASDVSDDYYYDLSELECGQMLIEVFGKSKVSLDLIAALVLKPIHIPKEQICKMDAKLVALDTPECLNFIVWIYPDEGIECPCFPGWYFIPDHTRYLVNRKTKQIFSTITGEIISNHLTINGDGYFTCRISSDVASGVNNGSLLGIHRIIGLTFKKPPLDSDRLIVNHIDHIRTNNDEDNLEWVTQSENILKANAHWAKVGRERACKLLNLVTGDILIFESLDKVAQEFNCARSTVLASLISSAPKQVFKDEWYVFDEHENTDVIDREKALANRSNSKPKKVLVKNVTTGNVVEYESAVQVLKDYSFLTKKKLYSSLINKSQSLYGDIIFKYATCEDNWRI